MFQTRYVNSADVANKRKRECWNHEIMGDGVASVKWKEIGYLKTVKTHLAFRGMQNVGAEVKALGRKLIWWLN